VGGGGGGAGGGGGGGGGAGAGPRVKLTAQPCNPALNAAMDHSHAAGCARWTRQICLATRLTGCVCVGGGGVRWSVKESLANHAGPVMKSHHETLSYNKDMQPSHGTQPLKRAIIAAMQCSHDTQPQNPARNAAIAPSYETKPGRLAN
jgi:hypothetical protein